MPPPPSMLAAADVVGGAGTRLALLPPGPAAAPVLRLGAQALPETCSGPGALIDGSAREAGTGARLVEAGLVIAVVMSVCRRPCSRAALLAAVVTLAMLS